MAERAERAFPDRILLPVTAAIYHNGEEKPAMRWSFEMGIGGESDKELFDFVTRLREGSGISDRCSQLKILKYKIAISMKDFQVTANCPKGRLFEIDSQEQWNAAIAKVLTKERELIVKVQEIELQAAYTVISNSDNSVQANQAGTSAAKNPVPSQVSKPGRQKNRT
ncbi:hypothetical protein P5673_032377 [Acropora cervicornis]|uniref:Uncharacterized protein n=1 Tax=Acropora cervicornis TaxID=6130 RepID=A0AAD9PR93_ACRCE|nr:hypothetical protein P5673_032377 [Acropora cervicornis]